MNNVPLITDGACIGNPGPGGWACILRSGGQKKELYGCERVTTNNRMEMKAVIAGLSALQEPCAVLITTDSTYLRDGLTKWLENWKKKSWMRKVRGLSEKQPVKNRDLWEELDELKSKHSITMEWVKGHADHPDNNRCDELAEKAAREQLSADASPFVMTPV